MVLFTPSSASQAFLSVSWLLCSQATQDNRGPMRLTFLENCGGQVFLSPAPHETNVQGRVSGECWKKHCKGL